jgi:predicted nuclease of predicted toxin-antitoxin system
MRILIDECLDPGIRDVLAEHQVTTVGEANWQSTADNQLIQLAAGNFDVLLTLDRGFEFQHNLKKLSFGIVIVHLSRNRREDYEPMAGALREAVEAVQPGQVLHVRAEKS